MSIPKIIFTFEKNVRVIKKFIKKKNIYFFIDLIEKRLVNLEIRWEWSGEITI